MSSRMKRWAKPALVVLIVVIGLSVLWWKLNDDQMIVRIDGHRYHTTIRRSVDELEKGLSGTNSLAKDQSMLFVFPNNDRESIWMKDMKYAIDIVWLNSEKRVVYFVQKADPSTYNKSDPSKSVFFQPDVPARYVIELPAGTIEAVGIKNGDLVGLPSGV